jgi:hypothetical protein
LASSSKDALPSASNFEADNDLAREIEEQDALLNYYGRGASAGAPTRPGNYRQDVQDGDEVDGNPYSENDIRDHSDECVSDEWSSNKEEEDDEDEDDEDEDERSILIIDEDVNNGSANANCGRHEDEEEEDAIGTHHNINLPNSVLPQDKRVLTAAKDVEDPDVFDDMHLPVLNCDALAKQKSVELAEYNHSDSGFDSDDSRAGQRRQYTIKARKHEARDPAVTPDLDDLGSCDCECSKCGAFHWRDERLRNTGRSNLTMRFSMCCTSIMDISKMPRMRELPSELDALFDRVEFEGRSFLKCIRSLNSNLAFASIQMPEARLGFDGRMSMGVSEWRPDLTICGRVYHTIGPARPVTGHRPQFAQAYVYDGDYVLDVPLSAAGHHQEGQDADGEDTGYDRAALDRFMALQGGRENFESLSVVSLPKDVTRAEREQVYPLLIKLQRIMIANHPLVATFKQIHQHTALKAQTWYISDSIADLPAGAHPGTCNRPQSNELAMLLSTDSDVTTRDIVIRSHSSRGATDDVQRISELHPLYDSAAYPLILPKGCFGWNLPFKKNSKISCREFYAFKLFARKGESGHLLRAGRLFQEYVVDQWAKVEGQRLNWYRHNQATIRADTYQNLHDAVADGDNRMGTKIILPPSFRGGPRDMHARFQDAMAIVRKLGKPDLFITVTCNPLWAEIQDALPSGSTWHDCPSVVGRVFNMKLRRLMDNICKQHVLGRVQASMYTTEFQKRGLPHAHILLILHPEDKPREPEDVDNCVRATIPEPGDPHYTARLRELVLQFMVHGPCGTVDPGQSCMKSNLRPGQCKANYPKAYRENTSMAADSYPQYRRPAPDGDRYRVERDRRRLGTQVLTNADIVPYNPWLLLKYETHLNVEVCNTVDSVKYIYKYILKGVDQAQASVGDVDLKLDEIHRYQNYRYLSSGEAVWRMLSFSMGKMHPAVHGLQVHLPDQQRVQVPDNDPTAAQAVVAHGAPDTSLRAWFRYNSEFEDARAVLYQNMFDDHLMSKKGKQMNGSLTYTWTRRRHRTHSVARMHHVDYSCQEQACLRLLLTTVPGCRSFEDVRTHGGFVHDTFAGAAQARGLLGDDKEFEIILEDLAVSDMPCKLRKMFARFLLFNRVTNPSALFAKFEKEFTSDFRHKLAHRGLNDLDFRVLALKDVQCTLHSRDRDFDHFCPSLYNELSDAANTGQVERVMSASNHTGIPVEIQEETNYDREKMTGLIHECEPNLNRQQLAFYNEVQLAIQDRGCKSRCYFLDAPGGTGKTYLLNLLLAKVRLDNKIALATASTGVAAILLEGGRTLHSRAKVPLICDAHSSCNINVRTKNGLAALWRKVDLLICDEVSMLSRDVLECVDRMLQDLMENDLPMGGKTVVFTGDFRQCLPVIPKAGRGEIVAKSFRSSSLYRHFQRYSLTANMRVQRLLAVGDAAHAAAAADFSSFLLDLGNGKRDIKLPRDWVEMPEEMVLQSNDVADLVERVYPGLVRHAHGRRRLLAVSPGDTGG